MNKKILTTIMAVAIMLVSSGTALWRLEASPIYNAYGQAWYNVKTYSGSATGWIVGSAGVIE